MTLLQLAKKKGMLKNGVWTEKEVELVSRFCQEHSLKPADIGRMSDKIVMEGNIYGKRVSLSFFSGPGLYHYAAARGVENWDNGWVFVMWAGWSRPRMDLLSLALGQPSDIKLHGEGTAAQDQRAEEKNAA